MSNIGLTLCIQCGQPGAWKMAPGLTAASHVDVARICSHCAGELPVRVRRCPRCSGSGEEAVQPKQRTPVCIRCDGAETVTEPSQETCSQTPPCELHSHRKPTCLNDFHPARCDCGACADRYLLRIQCGCAKCAA